MPTRISRGLEASNLIISDKFRVSLKNYNRLRLLWRDMTSLYHGNLGLCMAPPKRGVNPPLVEVLLPFLLVRFLYESVFR
jgi:hypothetical protein